MATILSKFAKSQLATTSPDGAGDVVTNDFFIDLAVADLTAGQVIDLGTLPAYTVPTDAILIAGDLDTGAAITLDVGLLSGVPGDAGARTCGNELFSASTVAQAGGVARPSTISAFTIQAVGYHRSVGVKIVAAPAGAVAGRIRLRLLSHPSDQTVQF